MIVSTNKKNGKPYLFAEEVLDATNDANGRVMCLYYSLETGAGFCSGEYRVRSEVQGR